MQTELIEIYVEPHTLQSDDAGENITGTFYLNVGGIYFPEEDWTDYVVLVLLAWMRFLDFWNDGVVSAEDFAFMEGPYFVHLETEDDETLGIRLVDMMDDSPNLILEGMILVEEMAFALGDAVAVVIEECNRQGWHTIATDELAALHQKLFD